MSNTQQKGQAPRRTHIGQMGDHHHDPDRARMDGEGPVPTHRPQQTQGDIHRRCGPTVHGDEGPVHDNG